AQLYRIFPRPAREQYSARIQPWGVLLHRVWGVLLGSHRSHGWLQHGRRPEGPCRQHTSRLLSSCWHLMLQWFLYITFTFLLGAICTQEALRSDFLIAEIVSLAGFLFLLGLYISSLASCIGELYGAPRILLCIAQEKVIPVLAFLGQGKGPNKTPIAAICLISLVTMAFVLVGQVNVLAPVVTINFMLTASQWTTLSLLSLWLSAVFLSFLSWYPEKIQMLCAALSACSRTRLPALSSLLEASSKAPC
ncbi:solute carrier family 12 member 8, partial [Sigmodon hispidus]